MNVTRCDRCKKLEGDIILRLFFNRDAAGTPVKHWDLCEVCFKELRKWMKPTPGGRG